jgi:hypothetical protein
MRPLDTGFRVVIELRLPANSGRRVDTTAHFAWTDFADFEGLVVPKGAWSWNRI